MQRDEKRNWYYFKASIYFLPSEDKSKERWHLSRTNAKLLTDWSFERQESKTSTGTTKPFVLVRVSRKEKATQASGLRE